MAKITRIPLGEKPREKTVELPEQAQVSLAEPGGKVRQGLLAFAVAAGSMCSPPCWRRMSPRSSGTRASTTPLAPPTATPPSAPRSCSGAGGSRSTSRAARSVSGGEVKLPTWQEFSDDELLSELALERMLAGLSTRRYPAGLEPVGDDLGATGTTRSSVSRRFVARTSKALDELMGKNLSELSIVAIIADGFEVSDHTMVGALGIDVHGAKHILGLKQGSTENKTVCRDLFTSMVERGLDFSGGVLLVIDGGKGLRAAAKEVFSDLGLIQRCRIHKRRNVLD